MPQLTVARLKRNRQSDYGEEKCEDFSKDFSKHEPPLDLLALLLLITFRKASDKEMIKSNV